MVRYALEYAGMAELADAQDLGSCGQPCGFDPHYPYHVGASFVSLAPTFLQTSERAHAAAPPFQIITAALGCDLVLGARLEAWHLYCCNVPRRSKVRFAPVIF